MVKGLRVLRWWDVQAVRSGLARSRGRALSSRQCLVLLVPLCGSLDREVLRLRMMDNDSRCRLFRLQLKLFRETHTNTHRIQQREQLFLIFQSRTCRITKAIASSMFLLMKQARQLSRIVAGDAEFSAVAFVPNLRQR